MKKNFIKFLSGRGSKSIPLIIFLAEKTEPNYDTDYDDVGKKPRLPPSDLSLG
jgi:hypothetical protein